MVQLDVSVIVPARNAAAWLRECLESITGQGPREVIVVDGCSTDDTVAIARSLGARVLSDEGRGLPTARMLGVRSAQCDLVALIDADVVLPPGSLERLIREFEAGGFDGLQFGLASEADGPGYWGSALAWHHNHSRVRSWFGVCATLIRRDLLLSMGFDDSFISGEDVELRIRLEKDSYRIGVSSSTVVRHRFADTFAGARDQWEQDGSGIARTIRKHPARAGWMVVLPLLATVRGVGMSLVRAPRFLPYWPGFFLFNYRSMASEILRPAGQPLSVGGNAAWLAAARVAPMVAGFLFWALVALVLPPAQTGLGSVVISAALLTVQLGMFGVGPATLTLLPGETDGGRRLIATSLLTVATFSLAAALGLAAGTNAFGSGVGEAWEDPAVTVLFLATAVLAAVAYQLDHVGLAQERADRALIRSVVQSVVQLAVVAAAFILGIHQLSVVIAAVSAGALASVVVGLRQLRRAHVSPDWRHGLRSRHALKILKPGLPNHALMLADRAPGYLLPLIVAATLGPAATAAWYIVWMMASAVFFVPQSAGFSLQTALAGTRSRPGLVTSAIRASLLLTLVAGGMLVFVGPFLLRFLGRDYASAWVLIPILVPALLLSCITQVYYGLCRAQGRLFESTALAVCAAALVLAPAPPVAHTFGLAGVSTLWSLAQSAVALIASWRLFVLTRTKASPRAAQVPSSAGQEPTQMETP
ncbi:O-antigen/teichoic acid export membrane protein/glycosyltransferase involved in cell wall biosynthesis [Arthrobacter sp. B3I9]|uniref:glycosyltransferase n=1 Tax=Arthrobacter sp. B3I9 TaxID=3042270 RepID=UPI00278DCCF0|nr:glycosyltransferase [Arthrobacter sp. B3I9]MDQ0848672.1 O-antigen/teichoic acid export membrane protein/glycosyltransferase involved in cell wall biosynthesis [Arthrobacter sp. B3I9]